jgi:hypothetical protein
MSKFFTTFKKSISAFAETSALGLFAYSYAKAIENQGKQLEKKNPGFKAIAKPQYFPGCGTTWSWELIKPEEKQSSLRNKP